MATKIPSTKTNIIANFAGKAWSGIINFAFVPLYIKFLGIEAYGLIGIFVSLIALLSILDMGLSATLNRALAQFASSPDSDQEARNLTRTFEVIYWVMGIFIGLFVFFLAPLIANAWVKAGDIPTATIQHALMIMGLIIAIQWPSSLYSGALTGLQRQVLMNGLRSTIATIQAVGAIFVLWLVSPTIYAYFVWQLVVSIVQTVIFAYAVWSVLPKTSIRPSFKKDLLVSNFRFAAGMAGISVVVTILTQMDKIVLSKVLPLQTFGYYILAINVGSMLSYLVQPIATALFPKFAQLAAPHQEQELAIMYHKGCQFASLMVFPAALTLLLFSNAVLMFWLRDAATVQHTNGIVRIVVMGSILNAVMTLPYNLQLAHGWTSLSFYKNVIAVILLVPLLLVTVRIWGAQGAALVWVILNLGYFLIEIPIMHRLLLKNEMKKWYWHDIGMPFLASAAIITCSRLLLVQNTTQTIAFLWIAVTGIVSLVIAALTMPASREWLRRVLVR
ncbi:MAG: oligosaccharide flippase family protein [Nitrospirota bacterium]